MVDEGCIAGSALAVNRSYLATGSSEGVVNIYSLATTSQSHPKPDKVLTYYLPLMVLDYTILSEGKRTEKEGKLREVKRKEKFKRKKGGNSNKYK
jgi:hypothetical protein